MSTPRSLATAAKQMGNSHHWSKVFLNCCKKRWPIPAFGPRSLTTAAETDGSYPLFARAHLPAANSHALGWCKLVRIYHCNFD